MIENEIEVPIANCVQSPLMISPFSTDDRIVDLDLIYRGNGNFDRPRCFVVGHEFVVLTHWDIVWYLKGKGQEKLKVLLTDDDLFNQVRLTVFEQYKTLDLNWISLARAIAKAKTQLKQPDDFFAKASGFDRSRITKLIKTATKLSPNLQKLAEVNRLNFSAARDLAKLGVSQQEEIAARIRNQDLTSKQILELAFPNKPIRQAHTGSNDIPVKKDRDTLRLEIDVSERVGYPVSINSQNHEIDFQFFDFSDLVNIATKIKKVMNPKATAKGKLVFSFESNENLDLLLGGLFRDGDED